MIDLTKGVAIKPNRKPMYHNGYDVTISLHNAKQSKSGKVTCITFYGEKLYRYFLHHAVTPYIVGSKLVFVIDDTNGYCFATVKNAKSKYGAIRSSDETLKTICESREGGYIIEYDNESNCYYIDFNNRIEERKHGIKKD